MADDTLPPLREVVARHGLAPQKALGQNFLFDFNLTRRIARASGSLDGITVIEIGPGPGGLTRALLLEGAAHVIAIERDRRCLAALEEIAQVWPGRLTILEADALAVDLSEQVRGPARIIANLPYNIGTKLLTNWLTVAHWPPFWDSLTLMFQREVAERIVAGPEQRAAYGRLGVLSNWRCETRILFDVAPAAFVPPPKITSSVVRLAPRSTSLSCHVEALEAITRAAFGQRRKMLRQSLKPLFQDIIPRLERLDIRGDARAEELDVAAYVKLAQNL
jgi:16S rRNA (adenine1518-N6/adenine1519-N6)-dimethyltransferase